MSKPDWPVRGAKLQRLITELAPVEDGLASYLFSRIFVSESS